jgi:hypothetical protein
LTAVFWDVMLCSPVHWHQHSSKTMLTTYTTTWDYNAGDYTTHLCHHENLKSQRNKTNTIIFCPKLKVLREVEESIKVWANVAPETEENRKTFFYKTAVTGKHFMSIKENSGGRRYAFFMFIWDVAIWLWGVKSNKPAEGCRNCETNWNPWLQYKPLLAAMFFKQNNFCVRWQTSNAQRHPNVYERKRQVFQRYW